MSTIPDKVPDDVMQTVYEQTVSNIVDHLRKVVAQYREVYNHKDSDCDCACCRALGLLKVLDESKEVKLWVGMYHTLDGQHWLYAAPTEKRLWELLWDEVIEDMWHKDTHGKIIPEDRKAACGQYMKVEDDAGELVYFDCEEVEMKL